MPLAEGEPVGASDASGIWSPFRRRAFLWLWLGTVGLNTGAWAQLVGMQWLFVHDPNAATIIALVQTASVLPIVLLVVPAGVLADALDRRYLLLGVQAYLTVASGLLAILLVLDLVEPVVLLAFVLVINAGSALQAASWQPLVAEIVPRSRLAAATRLDMVSGNLGRMVGPLLAGALIAQLGVAVVFAMNALCSAAFFTVLLVWGRPRVEARQREPFLSALRAGGRYVRHEPGVQRSLVRLAIYVVPASAVWVALPLVAERQLGLDAVGYGVVVSVAGFGAVVGALASDTWRRALSANRLVVLASTTFALAFGLTQVVSGVVGVAVLIAIAALTWTATVSTINAELQLLLPGWVRARALAMMSVVFAGSQALASPAWGGLMQAWDVSSAVWTASLVAVLGAIAGRRWRIPEGYALDHTPIADWREMGIVTAPAPGAGPVVLHVEYRVSQEGEEGFLRAMAKLRRARLRSGAHHWDLLRVGEQPDRFIELVTADSWDSLRRQHERSMTAEDKAIEDEVAGYTAGLPRTLHLLPSPPVHGSRSTE